MKRSAVLLVAAAACTSSPAARPPAPATVLVRPAVEVFIEHPPARVRGKRLGLITNQSGIDRQRRSTIDLLRAMPGLTLVALYSPEHGIRGVAETRVASSVDEQSGLPIHSLYGDTNKPTPQMLEGVDLLIYDIQDLGVRQYTYESTLALAMQAAAERGIPIIVLDRPNPVTGTILEGNILEPAYQSFVGIYPVLSRHGMTVGELAKMYNAEQHIGADLTVVPVEGWRRDMWWDQTGLPWVNPSPNIRRLEAAIDYPGTVLFEATNISEGRGTDLPFEQVGAPWLKHTEVAAGMNALHLPGVRFEPVEFQVTPNARKYPGTMLNGVRFIVTDRDAYRPFATSVFMIDLIRRLHPDQFQWDDARLQRLSGTARLRQAIETGALPELLREWERDQATFRDRRAPYLIYH